MARSQHDPKDYIIQYYLDEKTAELENVHQYLDRHDIQRKDEGGTYSIIQRLKLLDLKYKRCLSEIESCYNGKKNVL